MANERIPNLAVFCDYENVAIGADAARFPRFDIELVLARLLDKGKVIVKRAYSDWSRYKQAKKPMHEAAFELVEVPHVSYSGKNSADIRLVVDALDLAYTKPHVDVFVIISGDSDFSPLVSKLRENNKTVIAVGVKNSSSDLLVENCDEFIYYDDLVREFRREKAKDVGGGRKRDGRVAANTKTTPKLEAKPEPKPAAPMPRTGTPVPKPSSPESKSDSPDPKPGSPDPKPGLPDPKPGAPEPEPDALESGAPEEALELVLDTIEALFRERDDNLWGSMVKQTLKRKRPHFSESFYGYRSFNHLLEDARDRSLLEIEKDHRSGGYVILGFTDG